MTFFFENNTFVTGFDLECTHPNFAACRICEKKEAKIKQTKDIMIHH